MGGGVVIVAGFVFVSIVALEAVVAQDVVVVVALNHVQIAICDCFDLNFSYRCHHILIIVAGYPLSSFLFQTFRPSSIKERRFASFARQNGTQRTRKSAARATRRL